MTPQNIVTIIYLKAAMPPKVSINWTWKTTTLDFISERPVYSLSRLQRLISSSVKAFF